MPCGYTGVVVVNCHPPEHQESIYKLRPAAQPFLGLSLVEFSHVPRGGSLR
jgi:hypothetical protein